MLTTALLMLALSGRPCGEDFAADVARRAELMAADVETMPHVVKEGLRQLAYDARVQAARRANREKLRAEMRALRAKRETDYSNKEKR